MPKMALLCALLTLMVAPKFALAELHLGTGIHDATGVITDVVFMGMANPSQKGEGLHQRLFARTFVAWEDTTDKRFAFVSLDAGMGGIVLKNRVLDELGKRGLPYTDENLAISGTHTHSGPSGFLQDVIFQFSGSGWVPKVLDAMVLGVVESITQAHKRLVPAEARLAVGELADANINRSPTAYLLNPADERARYGADTDHNMTLLRLTAKDGNRDLGAFNWFAVHPTSLNNTNKLVSGDNKGYASYLFERDFNGASSAGAYPGHGPFVGAFAATNLGDVSPNTNGPKCRDTGDHCDAVHSTCNGRNEQCSSSGPGKDMYDSCEIIGRKQYVKAAELFESAGEAPALGNEVDFAHAYVKLPGLEVADPVTGDPIGKLCSAAMGDSFAAGTTDGPGMFDFTQGANSSNPLWHFLVGVLHKSTPEEIACQAPKGILLPTGSLNVPWPWAPDTLPFQLLRLGQLVIAVVPTELTTMAGRRLREAVRSKLVDSGVLDPDAGTVVVAGLSNGYADYTVTFEEYQEQRYEGGSTIFGPHQLAAYIQETLKLADSIASGILPVSASPPEDFSSKLIDTGEKLGTDHLPTGTKDFGDVITDATTDRGFVAGKDIVAVAFAGANPLNDLKLNDTYAEVQRCLGVTLGVEGNCSRWSTVAVDSDWETRIHVTKKSKDLVLHTWTWEVSWFIPADATPGTYRMLHHGTSYDKPIFGKGRLTPYTGTSSAFTVLSP